MSIEDIKSKLESMNLYIDQKEFNHAGAVGQILMNILTENSNLDLADMEKMLREMNSRVYLLALPMSFYNKGERQFISTIPNIEQLQDNGLWICMNGEKEAQATMISHNLTNNLNMENLKKCGFLMIANKPSTIN